MRGGRSRWAGHLLLLLRGLPLVAALAAAAAAAILGSAVAPPLLAQEFDEYSAFVEDSVFAGAARQPVSYTSIYSRDQARSNWEQNIDYRRTVGDFALGLQGGTSTSEDLRGFGSRNTSGDISGTLDWRLSPRWVVSLNGAFSMNSLTEQEQRRNRLAIKSQYSFQPLQGARLVLLGSSEFQLNQDLRLAERASLPSDSLPDGRIAQRDSSHFSGRLDAVRGQLNWDVAKTLAFRGIASGSRIRPTAEFYSTLSFRPQDGSAPLTITEGISGQRPSDNSLLDGALTFSGVRATTAVLQSKRSGIDRVYFDIQQLRFERYSNDSRNHSLKIESGALVPVTVAVTAGLNRSLRQYEVRSNLNALVTAREVNATVSYNRGGTFASMYLAVNRTRGERQATSNGLTISRLASANVTQRVFHRFWLVGLGSASLFSNQYLVPAGSNRTFSINDRDIANAFGSIGMRFAVTPRCSTAANFSVNRSHNVSIDATQSAGNIARTRYQINGAIRLPLTRDITVGQDYVLSATYGIFDYVETRNDLSREFRLETMVADTLAPFAYLRLDHRYSFSDLGDFAPITQGGPRLYGVSQEKFQQILEGTVGIRPIPGVALIAKQSLADTRTHQIAGDTRQATKQWYLSLSLEVNRSFWDGAGLIGAVRHESEYQNVGTRIDSINRRDHWIAGVTFQKDF